MNRSYHAPLDLHVCCTDHLADETDIKGKKNRTFIQRKRCCKHQKKEINKESIWVGMHKQYITRPDYVSNPMVEDVDSFKALLDSVCLRAPEHSHGLSNFGKLAGVGEKHGFEFDAVKGVCTGLVWGGRSDTHFGTQLKEENPAFASATAAGGSGQKEDQTTADTEAQQPAVRIVLDL